ncbi:Uma2 family endonuclease [Streptomyces sp. NPDC054834]
MGGVTGAFGDMLRIVEELDTPVGYKAELIRGKIVLSPWPKLRYMKAMRSLRFQLESHVPGGHDVDAAPFLFTFSGCERAYGPALHVADESAFEAEGRHADGAALSLVAELTSDSTKDADWLDKLETYGRVVPVYLLLDMHVQEINAFWGPSQGLPVPDQRSLRAAPARARSLRLRVGHLGVHPARTPCRYLPGVTPNSRLNACDRAYGLA